MEESKKSIGVSWDSPPETAVNTANPSRVPSLHRKSQSISEIYIEEGFTAEEKSAFKETNNAPSTSPNDVSTTGSVLPPCVDPATHRVGWTDAADPDNPKNFTRSKKWLLTITLSMVTFCVSFASSVFSTATLVTSVQFDVSMEVMILGVSLYVLGFACGPLVWGPLSEVYGRTRPLFLGFFLFTIFQIPVAVAPNVATIMICRFLGGCFGAAPIAIVGGTYVDFWDSLDLGIATAGFAAATFLGPIAGPIVGEFIVKSDLGWRWTAWITLIFSAAAGIVMVLVVPETFAPVLLKQRAQKMRVETKVWAIHAPMEEHRIDMKALFDKYFSKPFVMLFQEPMLMALTIHSSLVYSILYLIFFAYPYSFRRMRGWDEGISSLPFLGIFAGIVACCIYIAIDTKVRFNKALVLPEARLPPMMVGAVILPIGLFWFAWTSDPDITWIPQVISGVLIGAGIFLVFLPGQIYIVDVYLLNANSALAATAFARAAMAAGFPLFATYMYEDLGVAWATSLLAFLCVAMAPFPFLFYKFGERFRKRGKFAFAL